MIIDVSVHLKGDEKVEMGKTIGGSAWLSLSDQKSADSVIYFPSTSVARVFLATALAELRRVERGDDPIDTYHDHIDVPRTVIMNGKEVTVVS